MSVTHELLFVLSLNLLAKNKTLSPCMYLYTLENTEDNSLPIYEAFIYLRNKNRIKIRND